MVVYQALSAYQIIECIEHKEEYHLGEEAVLILGTYIVEKYSNYKQIETYGFFDKVYLFEFGNISGTEEQIVVTVQNRLKELLPFELSEVDKIYIAGIHTYLGVYLIKNNIKFSMFEDGSGALSRPWILADITKKSNSDRYQIINKYGLYNHTSDLIVEKWCNVKSQLADFQDQKEKNYDVVEGFKKLSTEKKERLLSFFGIYDKIEVKKNSVLLLTQQFSNLGQLSFEEHIRIYQSLFDFYLSQNDEIVMKLHPDDIMYYEKLFDNINIVKSVFPAELLPFVFSNMPRKVVTISSTGINLIRDQFKECLEFNALYEKTFKFDHIYYIIAILLKIMNEVKVDFYGINIVQMKNMLSAVGKHDIELHCRQFNESKFSDILLIDDFETDYSLNQLKKFEEEYNTVIYLNSKKMFTMYDEIDRSRFLEMYPWQINITKYVESDNGLEDTEDIVWMKSSEERWICMTETFEMSKKLKNMGAVLNAKTPQEHELEIKRLKGLLEATERRLLDYIQREKELTEEIQRLKNGEEE